ncbi:MAG: helix-turn-helix domain-containing protein [Herpetosiphon sp.]
MLDKLGQRLGAFRSALGLTQQELADRIAVSRTAVSHFEMELAVPSERTIVLLAGVFKCEPLELVRGTYYPTAKVDRLPPTAARYTEVEKELCLFEHMAGWVEQWAREGQWAVRDVTLQHWTDRLIRLHDCARTPAEREMVATALTHARELARQRL